VQMVPKGADCSSSGDQVTIAVIKHPFGPVEGEGCELGSLLRLSHVNICNLLYYYEQAGRSHLVLEFAPSGDLGDFLRKNFKPSQGGIGILAELFAYQLGRAIAHCHANHVIHRDIKPENLLLDANRAVVKLTDFGCALVMRPDGTAAAGDADTNYVGTRPFRSPEISMGAPARHKSIDVWALAVVLTEFFSAAPIFDHRGKEAEHLKRLKHFLGEPTVEDFQAMQVPAKPFPGEKKATLADYFSMITDADRKGKVVDLMSRAFVYQPDKRLSSWEVRQRRDDSLFQSLFVPC